MIILNSLDSERCVGFLVDNNYKVIYHWWWENGTDLSSVYVNWAPLKNNTKKVKKVRNIKQFEKWYSEKYFLELL